MEMGGSGRRRCGGGATGLGEGEERGEGGRKAGGDDIADS